MNATTHKEIILNLIFNDLVNCKLIYGLRALHIDAGVYSLCMAEAIFKLMGFDEERHTPELYNVYARLSRKATAANFDDADNFHMQLVALEIYEKLLNCL